MIHFSCLTGVPTATKGLVRELRVRWMLEELGLPYEAISYPHSETKGEEYKKLQPFGQVPYFSSDDLCMFESGAILLHLAFKYNKLLPSEEIDRAHTLQWMFAALTSVEPFFFHSFMLRNDPEASEASKSKALKIVFDRIKVLSESLGAKVYFGKDFSIAEIIMTTTLRPAKRNGFLAEYENLLSYLERNESRPAFQRALSQHEKLYEENL